MTYYLPIAEMPINLLLFLAMGAAVGFVSAMFGVGGGFLMTPLLVFSGIPPAVAVATESAHIVAGTARATLGQWRRRSIDVQLGAVLVGGGIVGCMIGVELVRILRRIGVFDLFLTVCYVGLLGVIGLLMLAESIAAIRATRRGRVISPRRSGQHSWIHGLPWKVRFQRSKLYISAVAPVSVGAFVGLLTAVMGVGGGFLLIPALIYLLRVPTSVVIGTSMFHIVFVTAAAAVLHATCNNTVDVVLAGILILGGVLGARFGVRAGEKLKSEQLRFLLAALVLAVAVRMAWSLFVMPDDLYSITPAQGR